MSKIIIHNNSKKHDALVTYLVTLVMDEGFLSGENQYCFITTMKHRGVEIQAKPTRGTTHTFEVRDL